MNIQRKVFRSSILGDFYLLWTAPIEERVIKSLNKQETKPRQDQDVNSYIFQNIVIDQKKKRR